MSLLGGIEAVVFDVDGTLLHAHDPGGVRGLARDRETAAERRLRGG